MNQLEDLKRFCKKYGVPLAVTKTTYSETLWYGLQLPTHVTWFDCQYLIGQDVNGVFVLGATRKELFRGTRPQTASNLGWPHIAYRALDNSNDVRALTFRAILAHEYPKLKKEKL